jgi:hypothetical protein
MLSNRRGVYKIFLVLAIIGRRLRLGLCPGAMLDKGIRNKDIDFMPNPLTPDEAVPLKG